jgi:hypothetical protein
MTARVCAMLLTLASIGAGCDANLTAPAIAMTPAGAPAIASLAVLDFTVTLERRPTAQEFWYTPILTLAETSGLSDARIVEMNFELLDVGVQGRVPRVSEHFTVNAGGTLTIAEDNYGGPWLQIISSWDAARVSVTIKYVDSAGRESAVSAIAQVSRNVA